nr:aminotransferase class I/II-fold pyridoxal phosphate-dependent enzyme [Acidobacteriota bacterium]
ALEDAALESGARLLYCMPSVQNPTARVMSNKRRQDIVRIAERLNLLIVEDDAYGFLVQGHLPLCHWAADRTFYLTSMRRASSRVSASACCARRLDGLIASPVQSSPRR